MKPKNFAVFVMISLAVALGYWSTKAQTQPAAAPRAKTGKTVNKQELSRTATEQLARIPETQIDQLPANLRDSAKQFRQNLNEMTQAEKLDNERIKRLASDSEQMYATVHDASGKNAQLVDTCLGDCQFARDRCQSHAGDWFDNYLCNLQATGCTLGCFAKMIVPGAK
jgi:hypothetical protein